LKKNIMHSLKNLGSIKLEKVNAHFIGLKPNLIFLTCC